MTVYPKDGSVFTVLVPTAYRWKAYKPEGARQMKALGRWQKRQWRGDYFSWENCEEPDGVMMRDPQSRNEDAE